MNLVNYVIHVIAFVWFCFLHDPSSSITTWYDFVAACCVAWSLGRLVGKGVE